MDPATRQMDQKGVDDVPDMCSKHSERGPPPEAAYPPQAALAEQVAVDHQLQNRSATASDHDATPNLQGKDQPTHPSGVSSRAQGVTEQGTRMSGVSDGVNALLSDRDIASRLAVAPPAPASMLPQQKETPAQHQNPCASAPSKEYSFVQDAEEPSDLSSLRQNVLPASQSRSGPQVAVTKLSQVSKSERMVIPVSWR